MKFRDTKCATVVVRACGEQGHVMKSEGLVSTELLLGKKKMAPVVDGWGLLHNAVHTLYTPELHAKKS